MAAVFLQDFLGNRLGERIGCRAGIALAGPLRDRKRIADREIEHAFGSDEAKGLGVGALTAAGFEIHVETDLEAWMSIGFRVIVEARHEIGNVASVFPVIGTAAR